MKKIILAGLVLAIFFIAEFSYSETLSIKYINQESGGEYLKNFQKHFHKNFENWVHKDQIGKEIVRAENWMLYMYHDKLEQFDQEVIMVILENDSQNYTRIYPVQMTDSMSLAAHVFTDTTNMIINLWRAKKGKK